ncbi:hypothetical protein [Lyngbya confervoides]|uniref:Uncharacterized protein n=1 Tax=Lyngbya confervoides BDU141951 TaxID=1574623 RepID=A0ABD4T9Y9_9CYAN|nr:hypothetical protein [Lyngbya confervoides]MCM1985371.1 hypothetical protein [Lyngbya confervoides BDU141951]
MTKTFTPSLVLLGLVSLLTLPACNSVAPESEPEGSGNQSGVPGTESSQLPRGWKTYTSQAGSFSIAMPGTPKEESRPIPLPTGGSVPLQIASVDQRDTAYFTGFVDYPEGLINSNAIDVQEILKSSIEGAAQQNFSGSPINQQETTVDGVPCRRFDTAGQLQGKDARMEGVFCLRGDRLFEVLIVGEDKEAFSDAAKEFISSFKILKS